MNEVAANPFASTLPANVQPGRTTAVAQTDQQRAVAEVQAAMMIARMNPRNQIEAMDRIINACSRPTLADSAVYTYSRGGSDVSGPSIRLAEAMAQAWGNMQFGIRELEQRGGESTVQAYAWDVETNTRREVTFQVPHVRYTRSGSKKLEDPRDIYEMVANQGARRLRACILAVIPGDVTEAAVAQCETTMSAKADTSPEAMQKMIAAFEGYGVTRDQIEKRIQRRIEAIQPAQVVGLKKIYASLRDGMSSPADWFDAPDSAAADQAANQGQENGRTNTLKEKARAQREATKPDAKPQAEPKQPPAPTLTFAAVADALEKAADADALATAADLIGAVDDPAQRQELVAIYARRKGELA